MSGARRHGSTATPPGRRRDVGLHGQAEAARRAVREQASNLYHLVRREPVSPDGVRMASVEPGDAALVQSWLVGGVPSDRDAVAALEAEVERGTGATAAVAFSSGRAALTACLQAVGVQGGDEVIVPAYTCTAAVNAVTFAGGVPRFADIELESFGMDLRSLAAALGERTRAVVVQHLYGLVGRDTEAIIALARRRGIPVVEDAAQALGARLGEESVGTMGDAGAFSVGAGKVVEAAQGGIAVTRRPDVARRLAELQEASPHLADGVVRALLRTFLLDYARHAAPGRWWRGTAADLRHGASRVPVLSGLEAEGRMPVGYRSRMPPALARLALRQIRRLDAVTERRRADALRWEAVCRAMDLTPPLVLPGSSPMHLTYPVLVAAGSKQDRRWAFERFGVDLATWFSDPVGPGDAEAPNASRAYRECVSFPTGTLRTRLP